MKNVKNDSKLTAKDGFDPKPFKIGQKGALIEGFLLLLVGILPFANYSDLSNFVYLTAFFSAPVVFILLVIGLHGFYLNYGCKEGDMRRMLLAIPLIVALVWFKSTVYNISGVVMLGWILIIFLNTEYAIIGISLFGLRKYFKDKEHLRFFLTLASVYFVIGGSALSIYYVVMHESALSNSFLINLGIYSMYSELAIIGILTFGLYFLFREALPKPTRFTKGPTVLSSKTIVEPMQY